MIGNKRKERLWGVVLTYSNTAFNMAITLLLVPAMLKLCGESDYSVYKVMSSFVSPLSIVNFGISAYVARGIAQCNQLGIGPDNRKRQKILGMSLVISVILFSIAAIVAAGLYCSITPLYQRTFTEHELGLARILFVIMSLNICFHIMDNGFQGCLIGNENFIALYGITFLRTLLKGAIVLVLIFTGCTVVIVAAVDLSLTILALLLKVAQIKLIAKEKYYFHEFEKKEFKIFFTFSVAMILQVIVNNINQSMDNVILGAMISDKSIITMYSSALTIFTSFTSLNYVISGVFYPRIVRAVTANESPELLTKKAVEPAKYQTILLGLTFSGFAFFGKEFITLWIGTPYINAYYVCLILMLPASLVAISGIYEAFLDAKLKRLTRSLILFGMAVYNAVISIILVPHLGFWGAAIGTATSYIFGNLILLNRYSAKISTVPVLKLYGGAFSGIWKAMLISVAIGVLIRLLTPGSIILFVVKIVLYIAVYCVSMLFIGLDPAMRESVLKKMKIKKA